MFRKLQELLLRSIFSGSPLPGAQQPTRFPDLAFLERQPYIAVLDDQLALPFPVEDMPKPVKVLSYDDILREAGSGVSIAFVSFHPPKWENECVALNMEVRLASDMRNGETLGLGGIQVQFHKVSGKWVVAEEASYFAT
ncbi:hypothetical protein C7B82_26060 [Stenomitos frigidus ULC18]|uniref:Uncharacterized protein n=1 Tax=Stenomitos frigidus ULC18 TaxID=2107698 RepID=A0A2T1DWD2_9CYAN|nr:hypothetical protein C7B82_26060 [Stenomitos frigidus ULC18]